MPKTTTTPNPKNQRKTIPRKTMCPLPWNNKPTLSSYPKSKVLNPLANLKNKKPCKRKRIK
jgi:hypothetical protein